MAQGNDTGTQYRSAVYYTTNDQRELVAGTIAELTSLVDMSS